MLVLSFNMVIFVVVIVVLVRHLRRQSKNRGKKAGTLQLMLNITGVAFLFGLTWLFGALTFVNRQNAFQILFALTNSFQGFMIFIFFCVLNSDVRLAWVRQVLGKQLAQLKYRSSTKQTSLRQGRPEKSETVITEDITTLGAPTKLVRTLTRKGMHMNEVVELKFDDKDVDVPDPVFINTMAELAATDKALELRASTKESDHETVVTENITTLGAPTKLVRTLTRKGKHMNEAVELKFDDEGGPDDLDIPDPVFTEQINMLSGSVAWLKRTFSRRRRHMEEVVELRFDEDKPTGYDIKLNSSEIASQSESGV